MASRTAVFVDGGYLDYVLRDGFKGARIDYGKLAVAMAGADHELLRCYYYHCLPYQSSPPTDDESRRFASSQRFFNALRRLDLFEVREGKLAYRGIEQGTGKPIFEQKRVDILLAVDLVLLAAKHRIDKAAILTGDSDFIPAIQSAKNEGVIVELWHGSGSTAPHRELWDGVDKRIGVTEAFVTAILRP